MNEIILELFDFFGEPGLLNAIALIVLMVLCSLTLFPLMLWKLFCGKVYGIFFGFLIVSCAYVLALYLSLFLGRTFFRDKIRAKAERNPKILATLEKLEAKGAVLILMMRINPMAHFGMLNYALSLSKISTIKVVFFSWLGAAPLTLFNLWMGWQSSNILQAMANLNESKEIVLIGLGLGLILAFWIFKVLGSQVQNGPSRGSENTI